MIALAIDTVAQRTFEVRAASKTADDTEDDNLIVNA
jgi:hypothetical protein